MSQRSPGRSIRRILVALDASPGNEAAMAAAIEMASRLEAELVGLFVEDVTLFRLADLPSSSAAIGVSGQWRTIDSDNLARQFQVQRRRLRRTFEALAQRAQVSAGFRVRRGPVVAELLSAQSPADVLILHRASWGIGSRRLGDQVRLLLGRARGPVMLVRRPVCATPAVVVVYDGSPLARHALSIAARLAVREMDPLIVLVWSQGEGSERRLRRSVRELLNEEAPDMVYRLQARVGQERLLSALLRAGCGTLVLPERPDLSEEEQLLEIDEKIQAAVLLVR
jgi:nucleotide-binding universal stress UspA family protein